MSRPDQIPLHVLNVSAVIQKGDQYLLARRSSEDEQTPDIWFFPGGKLEMENGAGVIYRTLARESLEEVGIEIEPNFHFLADGAFVRESGHHVVILYFLCQWKSGSAQALDGHSQVSWRTKTEWLTDPGVPIYARQVLEKLP